MKTQRIAGWQFYVLAAVVFGVSLMKGLRLPSLWAASQMTFNYSQGFIRRGLFGELLRLTSGGWFYRYGALFSIAVLLFVGIAATSARLIWRAVRVDADDVGLKAIILCFAASPGVVFYAHIIGYLDYLGLLAVSAFVLWSTRSRRAYAIFYVGAATSVFLALIHESMVVMFTPTMLFAMICHTVVRSRDTGGGQPSRASLIAHTSVVGVAAFMAVILIGHLGTRSSTIVQALQASIAQQATFPLRPDAFETLSQPVTESFFHIMPAMFRYHPYHTMQVVHGLIVSSAGLFAMGAYGVLLIRRTGLPYSTRRTVTVAFVAAILAPLSLNFVGWDAARWNTMAFFDALFCVAILKLFFTATAPDPAAQRVDEPWLPLVAAIAVVLGLVSNYERFFFDGRVVQWFPFDHQFAAFISLFRDGLHPPGI